MQKVQIEPQELITETLRNALTEKIRKNPSYSMRAFARDLGLGSSYLSMVLTGQRKISLERSQEIAEILDLGPRKTTQFVRAVALASLEKSSLEKIRRSLFDGHLNHIFSAIEVDQFQFFSQWYHVAILDLVTCHGAKSDPEWIAERLGITPAAALEAIDRLLRLGQLKKKGNRFQKTQEKFVVSTVNSQAAIRSFHQQMIEKAKAQLEIVDDQSFHHRDITGLTFAVDPSKMDEAKHLVARFKREMYDLMSDGDLTEVFQLNIQLFPLTKIKNSEES